MGQGEQDFIIGQNDLILITGANGFIGSKLVASLWDKGFRNLRCIVRTSSKGTSLKALSQKGVWAEVVNGNLLSREDCRLAARNAALIFHLASGTGDKSFPDAYMNSVVTTRNLLEACLEGRSLQRFVSISSFAVYTNKNKSRRRLLDETCPTETRPELTGDAYSYAKLKQDELVAEYGDKFNVPYVIVRPGYVYGPGRTAITGRVGIDTFGFFLHLGGPSRIPFTYVDNCAEAIVLVGLTKGVDRQVFNVVDDNLPTSRQFLRLYKRNVKRFKSLYLPHPISWGFCYLWERYSVWSEGQLEPAFNRRKWHSFWKKTSYSNQKLKKLVGWEPRVSMEQGLRNYFGACRGGGLDA